MINKKVIVGRRERQEVDMANDMFKTRDGSNSPISLSKRGTATHEPTRRVVSLVDEMKKRQVMRSRKNE